MPRKPLYRSSLPYHVVNRANNRDFFVLPVADVWPIFARECYRISLIYEARIHALVLMSNHFHALISTGGSDLGEVMRELGRSVTRTFNLNSGRSGHLFSGRYKWSLVNSPLYYAHALKYVYRNPVKAGLVERAESYCYSTLSGVVGNTALPFRLYDPLDQYDGRTYVPEDCEALLTWINTPFKKEHDELIRKGLSKRTFAIPLNRSTRQKSDLELTIQ